MAKNGISIKATFAPARSMLEFERFIAGRTTFGKTRSFSRIILRIALAAVALSVGVMIVSDCIVEGFQREINGKVTGFAAPIVISKTKTVFSYDQEPMTLRGDTIQALKKIDGVTTVQPFALKPVILKTESTAEGVVMKGVTADFDWTFISKHIESGTIPSIADSAISREIMLSRLMADKLELNAGDTVIAYFIQKPIRYRRYRISGIFETNVEEIDKNFLIADLRDIQALNRWDSSTFGGLEVGISAEADIDETAETLSYQLPVSLSIQPISRRYPQIFDWLGLLNVNIRIILLLMSLVAAINMVTALLIMVLERTQMIGILKAIGITNKRLVRLFVGNGLVIISLGVGIGNAVAFLLLGLQEWFGFIQLEPSSYYVSKVPIAYNAAHLIGINVVAVIFCALATLLPAIIGARISPIKALRFE